MTSTFRPCGFIKTWIHWNYFRSGNLLPKLLVMQIFQKLRFEYSQIELLYVQFFKKPMKLLFDDRFSILRILVNVSNPTEQTPKSMICLKILNFWKFSMKIMKFFQISVSKDFHKFNKNHELGSKHNLLESIAQIGCIVLEQESNKTLKKCAESFKSHYTQSPYFRISFS